jgi:hypothetical protein
MLVYCTELLWLSCLAFEAFCFVLVPVTAGQTTVHTEYQIRGHEFNVK